MWLRYKWWRALPLLACLLLADGLWIQAKAWLAQVLIADAWSRTLDEGGASRPWPWADTWPVGRIEMPSQGADLYVLDGAHGSALAFGPGRLHGTRDPGLPGLSIIGGHRDTHLAFLRHVAANDRLWVTTREGLRRPYRITDLRVMDSQQEPLLADARRDQILLVTCYPFDALQPGGPLRYVVTAEPVMPAAVAEQLPGSATGAAG